MIAFKYKILLLGSASVGKTSLLLRYVKNSFEEDYSSTIGAKFLTKEIELHPDDDKDEIIHLSLWDIAGQKRFFDLRTTFYRGAQGAFLIFDLTRKETFEELDEWYNEMTPVLGDDIPLVLVGNKSDLAKNKKNRAVSIDEAKKFAQNKNTIYIETSAKTGDHVEEAFYEIVRIILHEKQGIEVPKRELKALSEHLVLPQLITKTKFREYLKSKGMRTAKEVIDGVVLNELVATFLDKAISRAKKNGRKTVKPRDL